MTVADYLRGGFRAGSVALLAVLWFGVVPALFMLLYTLIEVQAAARTAAGNNSALATFLVVTRANDIAKLETKRQFLEDAKANAEAAADQKWNLELSRRTKLIDALSDLDGYAGSTVSLDDFEKKCATPDQLLGCARQIIENARQVASEQAVGKIMPGASGARVSLSGVAATIPKAEANQGDFEVAIDDYATAATAAQRATTQFALVKQQLDALTGLNAAPAAPPAAAAGAAAATPEPAAGGTPTAIGAVALSYNDLSGIPFFTRMFFLPSGVVVAFFTALMGAVGASVSSLVQAIAAHVEGNDGVKRARFDLRSMTGSYIAFGARPLLGGLAGFMVFFVISAGAAFLVQPSAGGATEAVNSLSPAALASLGVFAGLAASNALQWLTAKAVSFFQLPDNARQEQHG